MSILNPSNRLTDSLLAMENRFRGYRKERPLSQAQFLPWCQMIADENFRPAQEHTRVFHEDTGSGDQRATSPIPRASSKRKVPPTCECPKEMHRKQRRIDPTFSSSKARDLSSAEKLFRPSATADSGAAPFSGRNLDSDKETTKTDATLEVASGEEIAARTCSHCKGLKKPPRGKKIAWRKRTGRWMYVREDAPEEEDAEEAEDVPAVSPTASAGCHDQDDEESDIKLANVFESDETTAPSDAAASYLESLIAIETAEAVAADPATEHEGPAAETFSSPQNAFSDSGDAPWPVSGNGLEDSVLVSPSAAQHVDVDLTVNDDDSDEAVVIKSRAVVGKDSEKACNVDESLEDLKYELEEVRLEKRKLELEAKETRIKRKIAKREALEVRKIKEEIKIED